MEISFQSNIQELVKELNTTEKVLKKAVAPALNETVSNLITETKRVMSDKYNLKQKDISNAINRAKATTDNLAAGISMRRGGLLFSDIEGSGIRAIRYKAKQFKSGVKTQIIKGNIIMFKHGFIATMPSGHRAAFESDIKRGKSVRTRTMRGKQYKVKDYPIKHIVGPSIGSLFSNQTIQKQLEEFAKDRFLKNLKDKVKYFGSSL